VILDDGLKYLLKPSQEAAADFDVIDVRDEEPGDAENAARGRLVEEDVFVCPPNACSRINEFAVVISREAYTRLAAAWKTQITLALNKLTKACTLYRAPLGDGQMLFLFRAVDAATHQFTSKDLSDLDVALAEAKVGCVAVDQYEVERAKDLVRKYGIIGGFSGI
jgi:hypothetical protein